MTLTLYGLKALTTMTVHCVLQNIHGYVILPATLRVTCRYLRNQQTSDALLFILDL